MLQEAGDREDHAMNLGLNAPCGKQQQQQQLLHDHITAYRLNADEVVHWHRAKMELQELSEGEHIGRSFHWSSDRIAGDDQEEHQLHHLHLLHPKLAKYLLIIFPNSSPLHLCESLIDLRSFILGRNPNFGMV
jgi:hypothetical protein